MNGSIAKNNPFRFSTKYQDDESDLVYYGYRYYKSSTGQWLIRDPIEQGNPYLFVKNTTLSTYDILGLWGASVHDDRTMYWAQQLGILQDTAEVIGKADNAVDSLHDPEIINNDTWSWHFNRSRSGDSRFTHRDDELKKARSYCANNIDNPEEAAKHLGYALHPDQDWVTHGDYNRIIETPNATLFARDVEYYIHNYGAGQFGNGSTGWPDDEGLDADASTDNGRPTISAMSGPHGGHRVLRNHDTVYWVTYHLGVQRLRLTRDRTKGWLGDFQAYVKTQYTACKCKRAF